LSEDTSHFGQREKRLIYTTTSTSIKKCKLIITASSFTNALDDIGYAERCASDEDVEAEENNANVQNQLPFESAQSVRPECDGFADWGKDN
jgi:hypothetical protein